MKRLPAWLRTVALALVAVTLSLPLSSCTDDETEDNSYVPEYVTGTTNANGYAQLELQNYTVNLTVLNDAGTPVTGASAEVLQGEDAALLWVELAGYYPAFEILPLNTQSTRNSTLHLIPAGGYFYLYDADPENLTHLLTDGSVTAHCFEGTLADVLAAGQSELGGFWSVRVAGEAAALGGGDVVNLSLFTNGLNAAIFQELMFGASSIMPEDVVSFCLYTIEVDNQQWYLPWIQISDVVQQTTDYDYKFILTWGDYPTDLDSYLATPVIDGTAHVVCYYNRGSADSAPYAWLDVDDTSSWGPEATTVEQLHNGTYTFAVNDYSGNGLLSTSGAHVEVFAGRTRVGGYDVPTSGGDQPNWWWIVGTVDGTTGAFTPVNSLVPSVPFAAPAQRAQHTK